MTKRVERSVSLEAEPDAVWSIVGDAAGVAGWVPALESVRLDGDVRIATFAGGGEAREQVVEVDDEARRFVYSYLDGPLPLDHYRSTITVDPEGDGSRVQWVADFAADPAQEEGLATAIGEIYADGLSELARQVGG